MTDRKQDILSKRDEAAAMLPFYLAGTLTAQETAFVEEQLAADPALREELELERQVRQAVDADASSIAPSKLDFDGLMARIDQEDRTAAIVRSAGKKSMWDAVLWFFAPLAAPQVRYALAAAMLVIVFQALALSGVVDLGGDTTYQTAATGDPAAAQDGPRLLVIFQDGATAADMRALLERLDGRIVAGPTARGVFTVELLQVPVTDNAALDRLVGQLSGETGIVQFVGRAQ
ncbi:MAG: hypothetical protein QNJ92_09745 [Alphaproteobacteria bacterium]|nr:hypothetical protein [Alphaproteobacteria bacterium]